MAAPDLTTTSFALLGHLAMRPWTMYELAQQMRKNVHFFYPRAESQIYEEPKRLVRLGLAEATREPAGRRSRTTYTITPAGREALRTWLAEPVGRPIALESEALLRVFLAPLGTRKALRAAVVHMKEDVAELLVTGARMRELYLAGEAPFQRYVEHRALVHDLLWGFGRLVDAWADRALETIDGWTGVGVVERRARAVATFRRNGPARRRGRDPD